MTQREMELENELLNAKKALNENQRERCKLHENMLKDMQANLALIPGIHAKVILLDISINGTPEEPQKGMKVRVDRLEQREALLRWVLGLVATTTIGLAIHTLWTKFTGE
jgi:hypothetical protein